MKCSINFFEKIKNLCSICSLCLYPNRTKQENIYANITKIPLEECTCDNTDFMVLQGVSFKGKVIDIYDDNTLVIILPFSECNHKFKCRLSNIRTEDFLKNNKDSLQKSKIFLESLLHKIISVKCEGFDNNSILSVTIFYTEEDIVTNNSINKIINSNFYKEKVRDEWCEINNKDI